ncbi:MAG: protein BatD [Chitinophagaceae bacterium]|nr:protein BatD [Chitinophagaceae bacterium]
MFRSLSIFLLLLLPLAVPAQVLFRTIAPSAPVTAGEPFRIQYYVEGTAAHEITPPDFHPFRLVEGPTVYTGGKQTVSRNYVYTLQAAGPGTFTIPGASLRTGYHTLQSAAAVIRVITPAGKQTRKETASSSTYYLAPGEDIQAKIREGLFVRLEVNKRTCYTGEPILATFKLYSRLESRSDIVKNPGFYGFTVFDMAGLKDRLRQKETWQGKEYDVHIIRKLQLFPLRAGRFTIDPMVIRNRVEFSRTTQDHQAAQEITEGLFGSEENTAAAPGITVGENEIQTAPVDIQVLEWPAAQKPAAFNGATGHFAIETTLEKNHLARNEEGVLKLRISGKGNFIQLEAPELQWPAGTEGFPPQVKDELDPDSYPLAGTREFRYGFVVTAPGTYTVPAVVFSFFDTDSNRFRTISSRPLQLTAGRESISREKAEEIKMNANVLSRKISRIALILVLLAVLLVLLYWFLRKPPVPEKITEAPPVKKEAASFLTEAALAVAAGDGTYYRLLQQGIWNWADNTLQSPPKTRRKEDLLRQLEEKGAAKNVRERLEKLLIACENNLYAGTRPEADPVLVQQEAEELLALLDRLF